MIEWVRSAPLRKPKWPVTFSEIRKDGELPVNVAVTDTSGTTAFKAQITMMVFRKLTLA